MLPKENRISKKRDIDSFFGLGFKKARGFSFSSKALLVKVLPGQTAKIRCGFIISTKIDKRAVVRNRIKRWLRALMSDHINTMIKPVDLMVVTMAGIKKMEFPEVKTDLERILRVLKLIK
jgi:ribonuclease P protein component